MNEAALLEIGGFMEMIKVMRLEWRAHHVKNLSEKPKIVGA